MRVLVACEFSGVVRDAFTAAGHDATSCDILPSDSPDGQHYQGNVLDIMFNGRWDLMIAHPPCTYLCNSGSVWLYSPNYPNRWDDMERGAKFFRTLLEAPIPHIAVENPIMHKHASNIIGRVRDQIIHPYEFGHYEQKATCLWLENLPPLKPTSDLRKATKALPNSVRKRLDSLSPSPDRAKLRSVTYTGIAKAMADQWGSL